MIVECNYHYHLTLQYLTIIISLVCVNIKEFSIMNHLTLQVEVMNGLIAYLKEISLVIILNVHIVKIIISHY